MTLQTTAPLERLSVNVTNREVRGLVDLIRDGDMTLDAPYQRGDVWTPAQRMGLVRSWLQGLPVPAIVVNDRGSAAWAQANGHPRPGEPFYAVIDGKQRLETGRLWFTGQLPVPASWFDPEWVAETEDTGDGPYVRYTGLSPVGQRFVSRYALIGVCEGRVTSVEEEAAIFMLVNGQGTPMTGEDMSRAAHLARDGLVIPPADVLARTPTQDRAVRPLAAPNAATATTSQTVALPAPNNPRSTR